MKSDLSTGADPPTVGVVVLGDEFDGRSQEGLIRELLERRPGLKLIWVTGQPDPERAIEVRRLGVHYILSHPVGPTLMAGVLANALEHEASNRVQPAAMTPW